MVNDDVFAVIAEATRRDILASLRAGDKAVGQLVEEIGASQPTISKHLRVLREASLVTMRAEGQKRFYALNPDPLRLVSGWLAGFDGAVALPGAEEPDPRGEPRRKPALPAAVTLSVVVGPPTVGPAAAGTAGVGTAAAQSTDGTRPQQLGRTVGRAAYKAADLIANLPKFGRRRD